MKGSVEAQREESPAVLQSLNHQEVGFIDLLLVFAKNKTLIIGLPLMAAVAAAIATLLMPNLYTATAKILPPQQSASTASMVLNQLGALTNLAGGSFGVKTANDLWVGMLKSRTVADSLIARFGLAAVYGEDTVTDTRAELGKRTNIVSGKEGIISIEVEDRDPKRAADLANAYVQELERLNQTLAITEASQRRAFLEQQLKQTKNSLVEAEVALKQTQERTGLIKLDEQGKAIIEAVATLRAHISAKEVQLRVLRAYATPRNPDVVRTEQELEGLRAQLMKLERTSASGQGDIFVPAGKVPEVGLEYVRKLREVKYFEAIFDLLARQYEVARIDEAKDAALIQVLDKAVPPEKKSKPMRTLVVAITALVALCIAVLWALVREASERAGSDPRNATRLSQLRRYLWGK